MPLPERNMVWPPQSERPAARLYNRWGAWYSGDPEQLAAVYADTPGFDHGGDMPAGQVPGARFLTSMARGVQRAFWGQPVTVGQVRGHKIHVPLAGDIAGVGADLLYSEPPAIDVPDKADRAKDDPTQVFIDRMVDESNLHSVLLEGAETGAAFGGWYLRVRWDLALADVPLFDVIPPDAAVPEWRGGRLTAVTLWRKLAAPDGDSRTWRHLERHESGRVLHGLYVSTDAEKLGRPRPLTDHDETALFAMLIDAGDGQSISTGAKGLTCEYIANMRPHRAIRGTPLGRSDYQGVEPMFDALDEVWTSWMRDIRIGKGRLVVPRTYLRSHGRGGGASFDPEREVYEAVEGVLGGENGLAMQVVQFAIRVEEHARTAREITTKAVASAGYSPQTFGEHDQVAATATEVVQRERRSFTTRARKIGYNRGPLARLVRTATEVYLTKFDDAAGKRGVEPVVPLIQWPDGVAVDVEATARTLGLIRAAEAASTRTLVEMLHPDWDDDQVDAEVQKITDERTAANPPVFEPGSTVSGFGLDDPDPDEAADGPPGTPGRPSPPAPANAGGNGRGPATR